MSRVPAPRKGLLHVRAPKITGPARRTVPSAGGGGRGPAAKGGDEGYLYLAGVRDASKRITEYSVSLLPMLTHTSSRQHILLHAA
jgi:CDK-activating kinase assembly factor MAT1